MEWTIEEFDDPRRIVVTVRGAFSVDECRIAVAELAVRKDPFTPVLFDDREVDFSQVSPFDLMEINSILVSHKVAFTFSKIAILVSGDNGAMDLATKWQKVAKGSTNASVGVFTTEPEALAWLREN